MRRPPAVARVLERVTRTAREHELFEPGDLVLVSVSGGPDSVSLLYALWHLRRLLRIRLEVFHFDHRLRPGSGADAEYVRALGRRLELPVHVREAADAPGKGESVEAWATAARGRATDEVRAAVGARVVAEGHTLDDQAETVLLNLIRGGGLEAVAGIRPDGDDRVQPLLDVERSEVEAFCRALHLRPRRDPTNEDPRHLRNAIRLHLLPAIERATGRDVRRPIARSADLLREDARELHEAALRATPRVVSRSGGALRLHAERLGSLPGPVASRVVRLALRSNAEPEDGVSWTRDAVEGVLDLARGRPGRRRDLGRGLKANRDRVYVSLSRSSPESRV
jgi:tRNA(Ile)-lysidine synthase